MTPRTPPRSRATPSGARSGGTADALARRARCGPMKADFTLQEFSRFVRVAAIAAARW